MGIPDYDIHYKKLREVYVESTLQQRIHVAQQRMDKPSCGPNLLVNAVAAVEAAARAIALKLERSRGVSVSEAYEKLRI